MDQTNPELVAFLRDEFLWPPFTGLYDTQKIREARSKDDKWTNKFFTLIVVCLFYLFIFKVLVKEARICFWTGFFSKPRSLMDSLSKLALMIW